MNDLDAESWPLDAGSTKLRIGDQFPIDNAPPPIADAPGATQIKITSITSSPSNPGECGYDYVEFRAVDGQGNPVSGGQKLCRYHFHTLFCEPPQKNAEECWTALRKLPWYRINFANGNTDGIMLVTTGQVSDDLTRFLRRNGVEAERVFFGNLDTNALNTDIARNIILPKSPGDNSPFEVTVFRMNKNRYWKLTGQ